MTTINRIRIACHKILAIPTLLPDDKTYCNIGTFMILRELGLHNDFVKDKSIMLANEMYEMLKEKYVRVPIERVFKDLLSGKVFVACLPNKPHGHIAIIYPHDTKVFSLKWNISVPLCANIGKENGIIGLNWAFAEMPDLFEIGIPK